MSGNVRVTVAAVIERERRFLVVREQADGHIVYNQPAGHLEHGETPQQAVIRETLEETAWHFIPESIVGIYQIHIPASEHGYLRICSTGSCQDRDQERTLDTDILATLWLTRDELSRQSASLRSPMVLRCIDDYLGGARYPLDLITHLGDP